MAKHMDSMVDRVEKFGAAFDLAYDNLIGLLHPIDWTEPWIIGLMVFHVLFLLTTIFLRRNINFQMCLFFIALGGVYLAETLNEFLRYNWESFVRQNYFDSDGIVVSVLWSGPLLLVAIIIWVKTIYSVRHRTVRWKIADHRYRVQRARKKD